MLNSGKHHYKISQMEKMINFCLGANVALILVLIVVFLLRNLFYNRKNSENLWYIFPEGKEPALTSLYLIGTYWILFN